MLNEFINRYFIYPIIYDTGYNIYNTIVWAIIFLVAVVMLLKYFEAKKQEIDNKFIFALLPWIFLGTILRVLKDLHIYKTIFLITPLIYVLIFCVCFPALVLSHYIEKKNKIPYWKIWFALGFFPALFFFVKIVFFFKNIPVFFSWLGILSFFTAILVILRLLTNRHNFFSKINIASLLAHLTDAVSTFIAMTFFGFTEKHVLARFLIENMETLGFVINNSGAWIMFILKIVVVGFALFLIDKESISKQQNTFLKMIIILLGLAPGIRGLLQLLVFTS